MKYLCTSKYLAFEKTPPKGSTIKIFFTRKGEEFNLTDKPAATTKSTGAALYDLPEHLEILGVVIERKHLFGLIHYWEACERLA